MGTPSAKTELVRWVVPFTEWRGLSTWVITESFDSYAIVVAPLSDKRPEDNYPKYLIRFDKVLTMLTYEEACATHRLYYKMAGWMKGLRAYQWIDSPWLDGYRGCHEIRGKKLYHYVILGDDNLVEVILVGAAKIERVDEKRLIEVKHEV
jgi:hypothetical protein